VTIRVLLCDRNPVWRAGFGAILDAEPDIVVIGECDSGRDVVAAGEQMLPDLVLVDAALPDMTATEVVHRLAGRQVDKNLQVVVLTAVEADDTLVEALRAGARGYLPKDLPTEALITAVRSVAADGAALTPTTLRRLLDRVAPWIPAARSDRQDLLRPLTRREREVLQLVARGLTNGEIADMLALSRATVKSHVSRILFKLNLQERAQAVVAAYETGLVQPGLAPMPRS
jgi:DNA-binding NarL/FixJ family response regulator